MSDNGHPDARSLRARLTHPVIDADGHWLEYSPVMREEFRRIGGEWLPLDQFTNEVRHGIPLNNGFGGFVIDLYNFYNSIY